MDTARKPSGAADAAAPPASPTPSPAAAAVAASVLWKVTWPRATELRAPPVTSTCSELLRLTPRLTLLAAAAPPTPPGPAAPPITALAAALKSYAAARLGCLVAVTLLPSAAAGPSCGEGSRALMLTARLMLLLSKPSCCCCSANALLPVLPAAAPPPRRLTVCCFARRAAALGARIDRSTDTPEGSAARCEPPPWGVPAAAVAPAAAAAAAGVGGGSPLGKGGAVPRPSAADSAAAVDRRATSCTHIQQHQRHSRMSIKPHSDTSNSTTQHVAAPEAPYTTLRHKQRPAQNLIKLLR
jgi:hypothetical protein